MPLPCHILSLKYRFKTTHIILLNSGAERSMWISTPHYPQICKLSYPRPQPIHKIMQRGTRSSEVWKLLGYKSIIFLAKAIHGFAMCSANDPINDSSFSSIILKQIIFCHNYLVALMIARGMICQKYSAVGSFVRKIILFSIIFPGFSPWLVWLKIILWALAHRSFHWTLAHGLFPIPIKMEPIFIDSSAIIL